MRKSVSKDKEYMSIVEDIIDHKEFIKTDKCMHHLQSRYEHSIRVSYWSYRLTKSLGLNYKSTARAALLHDFFIHEGEKNIKDKFFTLFKHPKYALVNSKQFFELSEMEENIIEAHMFPFTLKVPKYIESWLVDLVDDFVAVYEISQVKKVEFQTALNFMIIILINSL